MVEVVNAVFTGGFIIAATLMGRHIMMRCRDISVGLDFSFAHGGR
jgi:hypothetical protein